MREPSSRVLILSVCIPAVRRQDLDAPPLSTRSHCQPWLMCQVVSEPPSQET